jgi:type IV fimbrial biogenesis protein FimT
VGKKGFTLVELLVALAIAGVLTGLALPSLKQWIEGIKVKQVARQIVTDLQLAKTRAVSEGIQYKVYFNTAAAKYYIQKGDLSSGSTTWTTVGTVRELSNAANPYYARDVALSNNFPSSCPDCVIFSPTGSASPAGKVTCSSSGNSRHVYVILSGRIRVE